MKKHESTGTIYIFDLKCGHCNEWFRSDSELDEPPRHTVCRHCNESMYDDDDITFTESKYIGYVEIDLFDFIVKKVEIKDS